jgi:hypothetical protein
MLEELYALDRHAGVFKAEPSARWVIRSTVAVASCAQLASERCRTRARRTDIAGESRNREHLRRRALAALAQEEAQRMRPAAAANG